MDYPKKKLDANPVRTVVGVNNTLPSVIQALDDQIDSMMELGDHRITVGQGKRPSVICKVE